MFKKALFLLMLTMTEAQAIPSVPNPAPLSKIVAVPLPKDTFFKRMAFISSETGVIINIDRTALQKHGITQNQLVNGLPPNQAIELIIGFCRSVETKPDVIVIRREDDGSLTITAE